MDPKAFQRLLHEAKQDPQFFHSLVFDAENVIGKLDYLDRETKAALIAISPEEVVANLGGELAGCDVTCTSSCGVTCAASCGYTTNLELDFERFARQPISRFRAFRRG